MKLSCSYIDGKQVLAHAGWIACYLCVLMLAFSCARENVFDEPPDYPVIDSINPGIGTVGTQFRIYGTGFSSISAQNNVTINGRPLRVDEPSSSTVLLVTIVENTGSGPVTISVNEKVGEGPVFTFLAEGDGPLITNVYEGWSDGSGYAISVSGLPLNENDIALYVNGERASFDYVTRPGHPWYSEDAGPQLLIRDPSVVEEHVSMNYADFKVTVHGIESNTWRYILNPDIQNIYSRAGQWMVTGEDELKIQGRFFGEQTDQSYVAIALFEDLEPPEILLWTNTEIVVRVSALAVVPDNTVSVTVRSGGHESIPGYCIYAGVISATATLIAGGEQGNEDGVGANARFNGPFGITVDINGYIYVSDELNHRIRRISPQGEVSTYTGSTEGFNEGDLLRAQFNRPQGLSADPYGNVWVADAGNNRIRVIQSTGEVTTVAGSGSPADLYRPSAVAYSLSGGLFIADLGNHRVRNWSLRGGMYTVAGGPGAGFSEGAGDEARFNQPYGIAINQPDPLGAQFTQRIYVADEQNHRIRLIMNGSVMTLAGNGVSGKADGTGTSAQFEVPRGLALDAQGNLYVADYWNSRIRKITRDGVVSTITAAFSDDGGLALFIGPTGLAFDFEGNLYVADHGGNAIYKLVLD